MRILDLRGVDGKLAGDAASKLLAITAFPEDDDNFEQALQNLRFEANRFRRLGPKQWQPTSLTKVLVSWVGKKSGKQAVCGYTALMFLLLIERGDSKPTLYKATKALSKAIKKCDVSKGGKRPKPFQHYRMGDKGFTLDAFQAPSSQEDISKAYNEYESVAHLLAAGTMTFDHVHPSLPFAKSPDAVLFELSIAASIEERLLSAVSERLRNHWSVRESLPQEAEELKPPPIEGRLRRFLELGLS